MDLFKRATEVIVIALLVASRGSPFGFLLGNFYNMYIFIYIHSYICARMWVQGDTTFEDPSRFPDLN